MCISSYIHMCVYIYICMCVYIYILEQLLAYRSYYYKPVILIGIIYSYSVSLTELTVGFKDRPFTCFFARKSLSCFILFMIKIPNMN